MTLVIKPLPARNQIKTVPENGANLTLPDSNDIFSILGGSMALMERHELHLAQLANSLVSGNWRHPKLGDWAEAKAMEAMLDLARAEWKKQAPELTDRHFEQGLPLICGSKGQFACAFMMLAKSDALTHIWLDPNLSLSKIGTEATTGNFWVFRPDGSGFVSTVYTPESLAEVIGKIRSAQHPVPEWLDTEVTGVVTRYEASHPSGELEPVEVIELGIFNDSLEGLARTVRSEYQIVIEVSNFGAATARVLHRNPDPAHFTPPLAD